jgi:hypothetical protein
MTDFAPHNMTGNSAPSPYVASASSNFSGFDPYHAFDGALGSGQYWIGTGSGVDYLQLDIGVGNSHILGIYTILANTIPEPLRCPKNWTMQGSNDGTTWSTVDTQTNQTAWGSGESREFACATTTTAYRYFRLSITANNGDATYTDVGELNLYIFGTTSPKGRITQVALETLSQVNPNARLTQIAIESLSQVNPNARLTQAAIETLTQVNPKLILTQVAIEVLSSVALGAFPDPGALTLIGKTPVAATFTALRPMVQICG